MALGQTLGSDYKDACPIFKSGVMFPYRIGSIGGFASSSAASVEPVYGLDLDSASVDITFRLPFKSRLLTCIAFGRSDTQGIKDGAATTEPVIGVSYGASAGCTWATAGDGTEIALITCDNTGDFGDYWLGTTTETEIEAFAPIAVYVKTAATSSTSGNVDGAAVVELWFAQMESIGE